MNNLIFPAFLIICLTEVVVKSEMAPQKIAVVTGGNKGIGFAIVKGLCAKYEGTVYLTARNAARGEEAVDKLKKMGFNPSFHQLDVDSQESVNTFADYLKKTYGGFDLLVNNAAIAFSNNAKEDFGTQAEVTLRTNYFSLVRTCDALFPLLRKNARVVNLSSSSGQLSRIPSEDLRKQLSDSDLVVSKLDKLMRDFVQSAKAGTNGEKGWGTSAYAVSKVAVSALTRVQQRVFDAEQPSRDIAVNSVHPGYVDTDMTSHQGPLTIEEGAKAPLWLALEAESTVKGKYVWFNSTVLDWVTPNTLDVMAT